MALGPGKYDALATTVRKNAKAAGVVVVVLGGSRGSGFSVQATAEVTLRLPELLRTIADGIEEDLRGGTA
jgi:23S rRNA pseudoU1915 N3-methylase RlmH